jgi:hypothetical protein
VARGDKVAINRPIATTVQEASNRNYRVSIKALDDYSLYQPCICCPNSLERPHNNKASEKGYVAATTVCKGSWAVLTLDLHLIELDA